MFILREVAVLRPKEYVGEWSLVIKGNYGFEKDKSKQFILSKYLNKGAVKNLIDGKKKYLSGSLTVENEFGEKRRMKIIIFTNHWKEKETDQDYLIYFDGYLEPRKKDTKNDTNVDTKPEIKQNENDDDWSDKPTNEGTKKVPF